MTTFIQFHILTSYPPANLNRDDLGRPKTAKMGGVDRLRVSSQSLKRAWRTSEVFSRKIAGDETVEIYGKYPAHLGFRSKCFSEEWVQKKLLDSRIESETSALWSKDVIRAFGKMEDDKNSLSQLAMISDSEAGILISVTEKLAKYLKGEIEDEEFKKVKDLQVKRSKKKKKDEIKKIDSQIGDTFRNLLLGEEKTSVDIALFGRMLASSTAYNVDAACQVSHAISVHPVVIEDDYFTAVDDLNSGEEDLGAAHIGETGFAAALFYSYICIDKTLLQENLGGNVELANKAIGALLETAVKVAPTGKQNSFGSRAYASYVLAEKGSFQPRSLSVAFLKPISGQNFGQDAVSAIETTVDNMDKVYDMKDISRSKLNAFKGDGSLSELIDFVKE